jgi:outer membrane murein-binding lipoprotein Lpp
MWSEFLHFAGIILAAGAIYGGIRSDLKAMHERLKENSDSTARAHERLDRHVEQFHARRAA